MARKKMEHLGNPTTLRVSPDLLEVADHLGTAMGGASRSAVLRLALEEGLRVLRRKFDEKESNGPTKE